MSAWSTVTWEVARAGGFTAFGLLTLSLVLGLALSLHWKSERWPRLVTNEMHTFTTLLALVFTVVHVAAVTIDPFTQFHLREILVPFASHYRPFWMGLGIVAFYLGIATGLSVFLRPKIGYAWWRRLHFLTFGVYLFATVHGIATGSDTATRWAEVAYGASVAVVGGLTLTRLLVAHGPGGRARRPYPAIAAVVVFMMFSGVALAAKGPLMPGWNVVANGGAGSGARTAVPQQASPSPGADFTLPSTATLTGSLTLLPVSGGGGAGLDIVTHYSSGQGSGRVEVMLRGTMQDNGFLPSTGQVAIGPASRPVYQGKVSQISGQQIVASLSPVTGTSGPVRVQIDFQALSQSSVAATLTVLGS